MTNTLKITTITLLSTTFIITMLTLMPSMDEAYSGATQFHGIETLKECIKVSLGDQQDCSASFTNADSFGDSITISEVCDTSEGVTNCMTTDAGFAIESLIGGAFCANANTEMPCQLPALDDAVIVSITDHTMNTPGLIPDFVTVTFTDNCNGSSPSCSPSPLDAQAGAATFVEDPSIDVTKVCAVTGADEITWTVTWENTGNIELTNVSVDDDRTGNLFSGTLAPGETGQDVFAESPLAPATYTNDVTASGDSQLTNVGDNASAECTIDVPERGYFVGGGRVQDADEGKVTHGFELHCDVESGPNTLEVNWDITGRHSENFELEQLVAARCIDDGTLNEPPPSPHPGPTLDRYIGEGFGRYNGECGAHAEWHFTDNSEPGANDEIISLKITDASGMVVLDIDEPIDVLKGNHQWVPHNADTHGPTHTTPCDEVT